MNGESASTLQNVILNFAQSLLLIVAKLLLLHTRGCELLALKLHLFSELAFKHLWRDLSRLSRASPSRG